jgi:hypothetical protein
MKVHLVTMDIIGAMTKVGVLSVIIMDANRLHGHAEVVLSPVVEDNNIARMLMLIAEVDVEVVDGILVIPKLVVAAYL